jgi:hypothetical protein
MSGSDSSARAASHAEPLELTVHSMPALQLDDTERRTARGRLTMLLVLLVCAAPVIASYTSYFVLRPEGRNNYATLVDPPRALPALPLRTLDGREFDPAALKGQWLLVAVGGGDCGAACDQRLYMQRQLREMLGRERDRIDKVWFVTDGKPPPAALRAALDSDPSMQVLQTSPEAIARWLEPEAGRRIDEHLYLIDPMGQWMLRAPADADPSRLKRDLDRLLRASASWDRPGR